MSSSEPENTAPVLYLSDFVRRRNEREAVRVYLERLRSDRVGRSESRQVVHRELSWVESELLDVRDSVGELRLLQNRQHLLRELNAIDGDLDSAGSSDERAFIVAAASYGRRQGVSFAAWRAIGVPADVLRSAGIAPAP